MRIWRSIQSVGAEPALAARYGPRLLALLAVAMSVACADTAASEARQPSAPRAVPVAAATATPDVVAKVVTAVPNAALAPDRVMSRASTAIVDQLLVAAPTTQPSSNATSGLGDAGTGGQAAAAIGAAPTVEELLDEGQYLAGASPVHLAIRGTPAASSVRCAWRGVARSAKQREAAIRFWLQLGTDGAIPNTATLEALFTATLDVLNPDYRETAKANFLAIARGGESMDYLFLTCFADYAVTAFLLGTGTTPTTVTVVYDRRDEAASYDLYVREHDTGTYGDAALQSRGEYEAARQAQVVAAEAALSAEIGGREAVVFLAPMGAHNAIGFEAWQAVAQWAVVTDDDDVVQVIRDDTPAGDPEHTQTLANLTSRITTAAAADGQATTRVTTVGGLQTHYRTTLLAYADITPAMGPRPPSRRRNRRPLPPAPTARCSPTLEPTGSW